MKLVFLFIKRAVLRVLDLVRCKPGRGWASLRWVLAVCHSHSSCFEEHVGPLLGVTILYTWGPQGYGLTM